MTPLLEHSLESKAARVQRLMALPYPDKVRVVEQIRAAAREIRAAAGPSMLREGSSPRHVEKD